MSAPLSPSQHKRKVEPHEALLAALAVGLAYAQASLDDGFSGQDLLWSFLSAVFGGGAVQALHSARQKLRSRVTRL